SSGGVGRFEEMVIEMPGDEKIERFGEGLGEQFPVFPGVAYAFVVALDLESGDGASVIGHAMAGHAVASREIAGLARAGVLRAGHGGETALGHEVADTARAAQQMG